MFCCCATETRGEDVQLEAVSSAVELPPEATNENQPPENQPPLVEEPPATQPEKEPPAAQPLEEPEAPIEPEPAKEPETPVELEPQAPPVEFSEFTVEVEKSPGRKVVGLSVNCSPKAHLAVQTIKQDSLLFDWNKANPEKKVQVGDAILSVNSTSDSSEMIKKIRTDTALKLVIRRVPEFVVCVDPKDAKAGGLGISFHVEAGIGPATICQVHEDKYISAYNQKADAGKVVVPGDIVLEVNGVQVNKDSVVAAIRKTDGMLNFLIKHPTA